MSRQIRSGKIHNGLVLANGGVLSYQHAICLSSKRRTDGSSYPDSRADSNAVVGGLAPSVDSFADGEAIIEVSLGSCSCSEPEGEVCLLTSGLSCIQTYTVEFSRDGQPETAFVIGRLKTTGHRFVANHGDQRTLQQLSSATEEQVGKEGFVSTIRNQMDDPESNVFFLGPRPGL